MSLRLGALALPAYVQNARLPALVGVQLYLTVWQRISARVERYPWDGGNCIPEPAFC